MIGQFVKSDDKSRSVTIIGAGISGLSAGFYLKKAKWEVSILEKNSICGGLLQTVTTPWGLSEAAAHSFLCSDSILSLCQELSVPLLPVKSKKGHRRFIFRNSQFRQQPLTFMEILTTLKIIFIGKVRGDESTLKDWAISLMGEPAYENLLVPFFAGIYASSPEVLHPGALAVLGNIAHNQSLFLMFLKNMKSFIFPKKKHLMTPQLGFGSLIEGLRQNLASETELNVGNAAEMVLKAQRSNSSLKNVIIATNAQDASVILRHISNSDSRLDPIVDLLQKIRYQPIVSVTLFLNASEAQKFPEGLGVLFPESQRARILGVLFNSHAFERGELGFESFSVFMGGANEPQICSFSDQQILSLIKEQFALHFNVNLTLSHIMTRSKIHRWQKAIPIYDKNIADLKQSASECLPPGIVLFGNYTGMIGLRGIIEQAKKLSEG